MYSAEYNFAILNKKRFVGNVSPFGKTNEKLNFNNCNYYVSRIQMQSENKILKFSTKRHFAENVFHF